MSIRSVENKRKRLGYLFLLPSLVFLTVFLFYPVVNSIVMSSTDWRGFDPDYNFVGLDNYRRLFQETPEYWNSMVINLQFAFATTIIQTILGFFLAFTVFFMTRRWQNFYKVSLYIPVILPAAVVAVMWTFIYTPEFGLINQFLRMIGLDNLTRAWLGDTSTALNAIIVTNTWRYVGFTMVLFYIAMLNISKEVLEATVIDGATRFHQLIHIFFPLTRGTTEINVILSITGGMRAFDLFYLMTGGGPGTSTQVVGMLIYRTAFQAFRFSRALTMSVVLFAIILFIMVGVRRLLQIKAHKEG